MPTLSRWTQKEIDSIELPASGQEFYWHPTIKGLGVKATKSGLIYVAQRRVKGTSESCRVVIGDQKLFTPKQAEQEAQDVFRKLLTGEHVNKSKKQTERAVTLGAVYERYKESRNLRPETLKGYDGTMRRCFSDWADRPITEITKDMIERRHKKISNANGPRGKGEAQANAAMRMLRAVLNYASATYEDERGRSLLPENPVRRLSQVRAWNRNVRRQDVILPHQLKDWYAAVMALQNDTIRDYLLLCVFTGLRRTEAAKLRWSNVDFKARTIRIPAEDAKNHEEHRLPMSDFLFELLQQRDERRKQFGTARLHSEYVFPGQRENQHLVESKWSVNSVIKASKVEFSVHTLRRTFETTAERLDISHYALKRLLNHKSSSDVTAGYIVSSVERLREPMQKIADELKIRMGISPPRTVGVETQKSS